MSEIKTSRPYRERFLGGYDRHELQQEVQKTKPSRRKRTASWALGASLALGGLGIPMAKLGISQPSPKRQSRSLEAVTAPPPLENGVAKDLQTAQDIARQVTGGVSSAVQDVAHVATAAPVAAAAAPATVAEVVVNAAETVKQHFFQREVPFGQIIYQEAKRNALPPELLAAVVHTESKFNPSARSTAGAVGLMQLVPRTGRWLGAQNLTNPSENITAGAKYLRYLTDRFDGDTEKAVAAYNAGEGNVRRFGGVPPYRETRNYVSRVADYQAALGQRIAGQADIGVQTAP
jgi:soluble lytic murein transglycosylase-like protein